MKFSAWPVLAFVAAGCAGLHVDHAPVTPQRPTLSSNANTTAEGTVEIEAGVALDPGDSLNTPLAAKWGADARTELFAGWSPWVEIDVPGVDLRGASDLVLGARHRFLDESEGRPAAAVQASVKAPTANRDIGTDEWDFFGAGILSGHVETTAWTAFYQLGLLGEGGSDFAVRHDLAAALSGPIDAQWGWFGELAAVIVPEFHSEAVFATGGVTYAHHPSLVFDAGVIAGLNDDAPDLVLVFGMTHNLGRLFGGGN